MTLHTCDVHLIFIVLTSSKQILPANKCPLLRGLSPLSSVLQRRAQLKQVLSLSIYHRTFPSPLRRDIPIINLPSCMFVCISQPHRTMVSCSVLDRRRVFSGGLSILYSAARSHSVAAGFRDTCKTKNISITEKLLKNESLSCNGPNIEGSSMPHLRS